MAATTSYAPAPSPYPVHVDAVDQPAVSRWLWLVKWLLAIPHYVVLVFLWAAFVVLSVVALFAILFTGRYPRAIFDFNVGVLRWSWRVTYYSYGALATDRYPPFTLAEDPSYPAHLDVEYPEHLSRGLALVKWWLLAIPHYIVVGLFLGTGAWLAREADGATRWVWGGGLVGILVLVAAVVLAVTGAYPRPVYDLLLGLQRWALRVSAYAALMTDRYPPFRLDQGPHEPAGTMLLAPSGDPAGPGAPPDARRTQGWGAGSVMTVIVGCVVALMSLGLLITGGGALVFNGVARDDAGYIMTGTERVESSGSAVLFTELQINTTGADWVPERIIGDVKITVSPAQPGAPVFFGIAAERDVAAYLKDAAHTVETDPELDPRDVAGSSTPAAPTAVGFWDASTVGNGDQELIWTPRDGDWSAVAMNPDGSAGVSADMAVGATFPWLVGLGVGLLVGGFALAAISAVMITLAMRHVGRPARA